MKRKSSRDESAFPMTGCLDSRIGSREYLEGVKEVVLSKDRKVEVVIRLYMDSKWVEEAARLYVERRDGERLFLVEL